MCRNENGPERQHCFVSLAIVCRYCGKQVRTESKKINLWDYQFMFIIFVSIYEISYQRLSTLPTKIDPPWEQICNLSAACLLINIQLVRKTYRLDNSSQTFSMLTFLFVEKKKSVQ